jgi:peptide/nickel transport system substrate-binding protein
VLSVHRRVFASLIVVAVAGVCASGCARRNQPADGPVTLRIGLGAPQGNVGTGADAVVKLLMTDPWLTNRPDGRLAERVASGWTWVDGGTTLRLKIRPDVYFHDGTQLTPEIAAQALRVTAANPRRETLSFTSVGSIVASGPDTLDIKLTEPNAFVLTDLSGVIVLKPVPKGQPAVGTGPFQVVSRSGQDVSLSAFPRYFRGRPGISAIEVTNYPTQRKAWAAMMRGEIDMLHEVSREAAEFVEAEKTVKTYSFPRPYYIPLVFSLRHPVLKQIEVRKAINEALDRAVLVHDGLNGRGRMADGPIWPQHWAYSPPKEPFIFNPNSARQRLDRAGLTEKPRADGTVPARFSFTCLVFANDTRFDRLAVLVQKQLADVGIDMKLLPLPQQELGKRIAAGDFDAFLFEMAGRSLGWVYEFWRSHEGSRNNTGYRSADAVLDRIKSALSDDETRAAVAELDRVLHDDPPAAFVAWQEMSRAVSIKFDVAAEENRDVLSNLWQWRPAGATKQASR